MARRPLPPQTTPAPSSPLIPAMSPAVPHGLSRPLGGRGITNSNPGYVTNANTTTASSPHDDDNGDPPDDSCPSPFPLPKLRLEIRDLGHPGAVAFLSAIHPTTAITTALRALLALLYASPADPSTSVPTTRSVTLVLRVMPGVAYTTGSELDRDHKEIHLSLPYVAAIDPLRLRADELRGVITHELVHCYQWNGLGSAPGGLVEGVADWVRLRCRLAPPHWRPADPDGRWDAGYQHTAYFLDYLERRFGDGTVRRLNEALRCRQYDQETFWPALVGRPVEQLWEDYKLQLRDDELVLVDREEASGAIQTGEPHQP